MQTNGIFCLQNNCIQTKKNPHQTCEWMWKFWLNGKTDGFSYNNLQIAGCCTRRTGEARASDSIKLECMPTASPIGVNKCVVMARRLVLVSLLCAARTVSLNIFFDDPMDEFKKKSVHQSIQLKLLHLLMLYWCKAKIFLKLKKYITQFFPFPCGKIVIWKIITCG